MQGTCNTACKAIRVAGGRGTGNDGEEGEGAQGAGEGKGGKAGKGGKGQLRGNNTRGSWVRIPAALHAGPWSMLVGNRMKEEMCRGCSCTIC